MNKNIELSKSQQNLWYAHQATINKSLYNVSFAYKILGNISSEIIKDCFHKIWINYPALRIKILFDQTILSTSVLDKNRFSFEELSTQFNNNKQLVKFFVKISQKPFLLSEDSLVDEPLIRFYIINNKNNKYLLIVAHHILTNSQSENIIIQNIKSYLENYSDSKVIPENDLLYESEYNEDNILLDNHIKNNIFWTDFLKDYSSNATIPYDFKSDLERNFIGETLLFDFDTNLSNKIINFCHINNSTVFIFMLSCMGILISRYSNSNDIIIGVPVSLDDNKDFIFNVNVLPIRFDLTMEQDFLSILSNIKKKFLICLENRRFNTQDLTKKLYNHYPNDYIKVALIQNYDSETDITINKNLFLQKIKIPSSTAKFDFLIGFSIANNNLQILIEYSKKFYKRKTILRIKNNLIKIINSVIAKKLEPLKSIELLSLGEITKQKKYLNGLLKDTQSILYKDFEHCTKKHKDSLAVIFGNDKLSYIQVNELANKLANYLLEFKSTHVIVLLKPNIYLPSLILAIFKVGKIYVPLDVEWPQKRIKNIIKKFNSNLLIVDVEIDFLEKYSHKVNLNYLIKFSKNKAITLEKSFEQEIAYIIHTSGTTGTPKGVVVSHSSLNNLLDSLRFKYSFSIGECLIQNISISFDPSLWAIFWPLMTGGTTIIIDNTQRKDPSYQIDLIIKYGIKIFHAGPSMLTNIMNDPNFLFLKELKFIIGGGEKWELPHLLKLFNISKNIKLWNVYGPTETTIHVTEWVGNNLDHNGTIPIGSPIQNISLLICDNNLNILPIGAKGELLIGGTNLAEGYYNDIEETKRKFINLRNPLNKMKIMRFYKTGDLVRINTDGNLEYIGRNDFQVKIRGHRIELGEIESVLSSYKDIKQSVVLAREHEKIEGVLVGAKYLVGYYVSNNKLDENDIFNYLQSRLPDYMVPSKLVYLENLPLRTNGKLDMKALPEPKFIDSESYVAPRNELEKKICQIWSEVLGFSKNNKIGVRDNFFRLGGDSIVSIQLVSRFRQRLGINVTVKDIFNYKTIERLYDNVVSKQLANNVISDLKTEQGILSGEVGLLPVQQWFFDSNFVISNHWNQSFLLRTPSLDLDKLKVSIAELIEHHDSFRLRYKTTKDSISTNSSNCNYSQYYNPTAKTEELKILDIRTLLAKENSQDFEVELQGILTSWQSEFNLEYGPLYSIGYIYGYEDGSSRIYFALHHLIVDTVSWRILAEDLKDIYNGKDLGAKGSSYRQWVNTIKEYTKTHESERDYWINILFDYNKIDKKLSNLVVSENTQNFASVSLSKDKTKELLRESNKVYNTQVNDILLAGLSHALFELTGDKINHIVLEGHGREEIENSINITKTLGWFTIIYPVQLEVKDTIGNTIKNIKETLREIPNKGIGYGTLIGYKTTELPKISFNYLGQFDKEGSSRDLENLWDIVSENSGVSIHSSNIDYNIININGVVIDGVLRFSILSKLDESQTIELMKLFKQKLEETINYTISQTRSYLTVSDIDKVISQEYLDKLQESREIESVYLANSLQQGFIYHALNQGSIDDAYRVQLIWQYNTEIDIDKLREAWVYAQKRYSTLRLRFNWDEELIQIIDKDGILDWRYIDLSEIQDITIQELKIKQIQEKDRFELYKLEQGNLFRIYLIKQKEDIYTCIFSNHHAILDGWSNSILLGYIHKIYLKLKDKEKVLVLIDHSYKDSQEYLQKYQDHNKNYWDKYISQIEERIDLSGLLSIADRDNNIRISEYKYIISPEEQLIKINSSLYYSLRKLSQGEGVTLNAILQYVWHKVLSIYGNSNQTVVGTTVSGRNLPINDIESSVGLYINTLPLIVNHRKQVDESIIEVIKDIQDNINEINTRSGVILSKLQREGKRLFDSLFIYENYPVQIDVEQQDRLKIKFIEGVEKLDYPLVVIAYERDNQLILIVKYASELFTKESIEYLLLTTKKLLEQIVVNPNKGVKSLNYLNEEQYNEIIHTLNDTDKEYPSDKTIHQLFQEQAAKTPNNVALVYKETRLTYRELNEKANQLANYLRQIADIKADTLIGLFLDRSEYILISMLGVLKAGGAYVPIDPSYPDERIKYILKDSNIKLILTNEVHEKRLSYISNININDVTRIVAIDSMKMQEQLRTLSVNNIEITIPSANLSYIIYTSGTTGNPKGVMIEHRGVVNSCYAAIKHREITKDSKILGAASYVFDSSVLEIYPSLFSGSLLFIIDEHSRKDVYLIHDYCINNKITHLFLTTKLAEEFLYLDNSRLYLTNLVVAGEKLKTVMMSKFNIINEYGPTENTVCTTYFKVLKDSSLSIGTPIYNTKCYVLDDQLKPLPISTRGELYIGGEGLARGYLNAPDLTAKKFIENPFQSEEEKKLGKNTRLYKTGDLVRWLPDGNLEYIGRNDFQVKIRGYRIELDEIESVLSSYKGIKQCAVLAKEYKDIGGVLVGTKYLVGYYVSNNKLDEDGIYDYLKSRFPDYMVPSKLLYLEKLPLTINGKLDRNALPEVEFVGSDSYVAPRNELEKNLCKIWQDILKIETIGINDNFFELGGNSLTIVKLAFLMNKTLSINFSLKDIFLYPTILQIAKTIEILKQ